jgi:DNA-directed RNA polymerase subunit RPC12/RpoP
LSGEVYVCAICGYQTDVRGEVVEFRDVVKLPKVVEKAQAKGRMIKLDEAIYICSKCSMDLYREEVKQPKSVKATCPRCGEVVELWL